MKQLAYSASSSSSNSGSAIAAGQRRSHVAMRAHSLYFTHHKQAVARSPLRQFFLWFCVNPTKPLLCSAAEGGHWPCVHGPIIRVISILAYWIRWICKKDVSLWRINHFKHGYHVLTCSLHWNDNYSRVLLFCPIALKVSVKTGLDLGCTSVVGHFWAVATDVFRQPFLRREPSSCSIVSGG